MGRAGTGEGELSVPNVFSFRALISWSWDYRVWIARCLETGSVATADDPQLCREMIAEIVQDELQYSLAHRSLRGLLECPSGGQTWVDFQSATEESEVRWSVKWPGTIGREAKVAECEAVIRIRRLNNKPTEATA